MLVPYKEADPHNTIHAEDVMLFCVGNLAGLQACKDCIWHALVVL